MTSGVVGNAARWEHFPHEADVGVRGFGRTPAQAFEQTALALTAIVTDAPIEPKSKVRMEAQAPDLEILLADWLNRVIYEMAIRKMLFSRFEVQIANTQLTATAWGEPIDVERHAPACEPKGATYTALKVAQDQTGTWSAACVVDV
jgi:protein archease